LFPVTKAAQPGKFDKQTWLREHAEKLQEKEDMLEVFRNAALESSPQRKLNEMGRGLELARVFFSQACPPTTELGADEFTPIMIAYVIQANPPFLLSNLVYIIEFCNPPEFSVVFGSSIVHALTVIRVVVSDILPDVDLTTMTRMPLQR
jgi:hypothetical protein